MKVLVDPDENNAPLIAKKLHVHWGHASASQIKRILADADGVGTNVLKVVNSAASECEVCMAFEKTPHVPAAGTSSASVPMVRCKGIFSFWTI